MASCTNDLAPSAKDLNTRHNRRVRLKLLDIFGLKSDFGLGNNSATGERAVSQRSLKVATRNKPQMVMRIRTSLSARGKLAYI